MNSSEFKTLYIISYAAEVSKPAVINSNYGSDFLDYNFQSQDIYI